MYVNTCRTTSVWFERAQKSGEYHSNEIAGDPTLLSAHRGYVRCNDADIAARRCIAAGGQMSDFLGRCLDYALL